MFQEGCLRLPYSNLEPSLGNCAILVVVLLLSKEVKALAYG